MRKHLDSFDLDQELDNSGFGEILTSAGVRMEQKYGSTRNRNKYRVNGELTDENNENFEYEINIQNTGPADYVKYEISADSKPGSTSAPPVSDIQSNWTECLEEAEKWYKRKFL